MSLTPDSVDRVFPIRLSVLKAESESELPQLPQPSSSNNPPGRSCKNGLSCRLPADPRPGLRSFTDARPSPRAIVDGGQTGSSRTHSSQQSWTVMSSFDSDMLAVPSPHFSRGSNSQPDTTTDPLLHEMDGIMRDDSVVSGMPSPPERETLTLQPDPKLVLSTRLEYAIHRDGSHGVVQGSRRAFTRCEDEPIHIPGAVQAYGMLVALREETEGVYVPRIASENSVQICQYHVSSILALPDFLGLMPIYQRHLFAAQMRRVKKAFHDAGKEQEPVVFPLSFFDRNGALIPCWCAAHYQGAVDLYVCEFELQDYSMHPLAGPRPPASPDPVTPGTPATEMGPNHGPYFGQRSNNSQSPRQPVLANIGEVGGVDDLNTTAVEVVAVASRIQKRLAEAKSLQVLLDTLVDIVREMAGFDRVMVYQFDHDFNGSVVSSWADPGQSNDDYLGLHFPASDIPPQARELYRVNKVRVLFDGKQKTARLVGREAKDFSTPLDLTHAYLRAISPVHIKYLNNMGVRSSMSMSLEYEGRLWGLMVCHSVAPRATRVPFSVRELCYLVGVSGSVCLEKLINSDKHHVRGIFQTLRDPGNPNQCITSSSTELLRLFHADCGLLAVDGEARTIGRLSSYREAVTLMRYMTNVVRPRDILYSHNVTKDFPGLVLNGGFRRIAGVLYIPLSTEGSSDSVVLFRRNQYREVHWAGKPHKNAGSTLEPRNSFEKWTQVVQGTSANWSVEEHNLAIMAQLVYGSFIRVWREKEAALKATRLKRLLLVDASHQVRTPLNAVINFLEMALEKPLEGGTREALRTSLETSKALVFVLDDLLRLSGHTSSELSHQNDAFDAAQALDEVLEPLRRCAGERGVGVSLVTAPNTTRYLRGDVTSLQRVVAVLVANAVQHSTAGQDVVVEWTEPSTGVDGCTTRISVTDKGPGLSERQVDDMFQEFEQVPDEDFDHHAASPPPAPPRDDVLRIGVGLAFVAWYVKQRNGLLFVKSTLGAGSQFAVEVPFSTSRRTSALATRRDAAPLPELHIASPRYASTSTQTGHDLWFRHDAGRRSPPIVAVSNSLPSSSTSREPTPGPPSPPLAHPLHIMVADDNAINVRILEKRLTKLGHTVTTARDGQECVDAFREKQHLVGFVLMDLNMPLLDGWASARLIRAHEKKSSKPRRTPMFAISGIIRRGDEHDAVDAGFDGWMPKPVNMAKLSAYLAGATDPDARQRGAYVEERFNDGGWFHAAA